MTKMVEVDTKHTFVIPKEYAAIMATLFSVLIALIAYIYMSDRAAYRDDQKKYQQENSVRDHRIERLMLHSYATVDVMQKLHPDFEVAEMIFQAQVRFQNHAGVRSADIGAGGVR